MPGAQPLESLDDDTALATLNELAGGKAPELEAVWNAEWEKAVLVRAIERLKQRVSPDQFQMFDLYVLRQMPVTEVASLLGTNVARVYLAKHRLSKLLREAIAELQETEAGL